MPVQSKKQEDGWYSVDIASVHVTVMFTGWSCDCVGCPFFLFLSLFLSLLLFPPFLLFISLLLHTLLSSTHMKPSYYLTFSFFEISENLLIHHLFQFTFKSCRAEKDLASMPSLTMI